ncbi:MAG: hypothetical protein FJ296_10800 [Planctomycetes bacterium]|nr:hypothetical protein [Planctomycetota bacterium]
MKLPNLDRIRAALDDEERESMSISMLLYSCLMLACLLCPTGCGSADMLPVVSPPPVVLARNAISSRLLARDTTGALAAARDAEARFPQDAVVALMAAEAHQLAGDAVASLARLDRAVACAASRDVRCLALRNRAGQRLRAGRAVEALVDLQAVLADGLVDDNLLLDICAAAWAAGDFEALRQAWRALPLESQLRVEKVVGRETLLHAVAMADGR